MLNMKETSKITQWLFIRSVAAGFLLSSIIVVLISVVVGVTVNKLSINFDDIKDIYIIVAMSITVYIYFLSFNYFITKMIGRDIGKYRLELILVENEIRRF